MNDLAEAVPLHAQIQKRAPYGWCPRCGEPARLIGFTALLAWLYCVCGNAWTQGTPPAAPGATS